MENKKKPFNFNLLMPFGAKCVVSVIKENRVPPRSVNQMAGWTGYFVGYGATSGHEGCYRVFNPVTKGIRAVSYNFCTIDEDEFPWRNRPEWQARRMELPLEICPTLSVMLDPVELNKYAFDDAMYDEVADRLQGMSSWGREDDVVQISSYQHREVVTALFGFVEAMHAPPPEEQVSIHQWNSEPVPALEPMPPPPETPPDVEGGVEAPASPTQDQGSPEDIHDDFDELEEDILEREQAQHDLNDPRGDLPEMVEGFVMTVVRRGERIRKQVLPTVVPIERAAPLRREQNRQVPEYIDEVLSIDREDGETWVTVHWEGCGDDQNLKMTKKHAITIGPSLRAMIKENEAQQEDESKSSDPAEADTGSLEINATFGPMNQLRAQLGSLHACISACDMLNREDLTHQMLMAAPAQPIHLEKPGIRPD